MVFPESNWINNSYVKCICLIPRSSEGQHGRKPHKTRCWKAGGRVIATWQWCGLEPLIHGLWSQMFLLVKWSWWYLCAWLLNYYFHCNWKLFNWLWAMSKVLWVHYYTSKITYEGEELSAPLHQWRGWRSWTTEGLKDLPVAIQPPRGRAGIWTLEHLMAKPVPQVTQTKAASLGWCKGKWLSALKPSLNAWLREMWPRHHRVLRRKRHWNHLIKQPNFKMLRLEAYLGSQTRKDIPDEKEDPQLPARLTAVLWLNTWIWEPEAWAQIWTPSFTSCVTLGKALYFLYLSFCIYKMQMRVITEGLSEFKTCKMLKSVSDTW